MDGLIDLLRLLVAALGGGFTVKGLDIAYQEYRSRSAKGEEARRFVDSHLTPLLKSADELMGKLRSLAVNDFAPLHNAAEKEAVRDQLATLYLIAKFWAFIEVFREAGLTVDFVDEPRGRNLQNFLDCLESKPIRLADRISQRAIGEVMLERIGDKLQPISFLEFVDRIRNMESTREWLEPIETTLSRTRHTSVRQQLLTYGVVIQAMIETLDPDQKLTRHRPPYPGKLSAKTWKVLNYKIFGRYLACVKNHQKYIGPPKGRPK